jgi:hypothetical protein
MESLCANPGRGNPHPHRSHHHMGLGGRSSNTGCKIAYKKKPVLHSDRLDRGPLLEIQIAPILDPSFMRT